MADEVQGVWMSLDLPASCVEVDGDGASPRSSLLSFLSLNTIIIISGFNHHIP